MDTYPSHGRPEYTPDQPLDHTNVFDHVAYMHTLRPRDDEHDEAMRKLYGYIEGQVTALQAGPSGVAAFFDREVTNNEDLASAIIEAAKQVHAAVVDRGRGQTGQVGAYFWNGAEDIEEQRDRLSANLWTSGQRYGVSVQTWAAEVMGYKM